jgi:hypothetical protein
VRLVIKPWSNATLTKKHKLLIEYFKIEQNSPGNYWIDTYVRIDKEQWEIIEL